MQTLQKYIADNGLQYTDGKYIYGEAGLKQMHWVLEIASLLLPLEDDNHRRWDLWKVCSFHTSKSVKLPVYHYDSPGLTLTMRNNFYNWNVSVRANKSIIIPSYMDISCEDSYLFFEGMEGYQYPVYDDSKYKFSFGSPFNEHLWAILWCITTQTKGV